MKDFLSNAVFYTLADVPNEHDYSTIEIMPDGEWDHAIYGAVDFNAELRESVKRNFEKYRMGGLIPVDFNHGSEMSDPTPEQGKAAGWIQKLVIEGSSLMAVVKWTKYAAQKIRDEEYRLISPAFNSNYTHPYTKKNVGPWLNSVALTNRPFLKNDSGGMQPVALTEAAARLLNGTEDNPMPTPEIKLADVKVGESTVSVHEDHAEALTEIFKAHEDAVQAFTDAATEKDKEITAKDAEIASLKVALADTDNGDALKLLREQHAELAGKLTKIEAEKVDADAEKMLSDAVQARKLSKHEADSDAWKGLAKSDPKLCGDLIASKAEVVPEVKGSNADGLSAEGGLKAFNDLVQQTEKSLKDLNPDMRESDLHRMAIDQVSKENPDLADTLYIEGAK